MCGCRKGGGRGGRSGRMSAQGKIKSLSKKAVEPTVQAQGMNAGSANRSKIEKIKKRVIERRGGRI